MFGLLRLAIASLILKQTVTFRTTIAPCTPEILAEKKIGYTWNSEFPEFVRNRGISDDVYVIDKSSEDRNPEFNEKNEISQETSSIDKKKQRIYKEESFAPSRSHYEGEIYGASDGVYSTIEYPDSVGYHHDHALDYEGAWEDEEEVKWGGVSVSSVFQMSLTALAFLAFGGFLLHLIIQAMKDSKRNDSGGMTTMSPDTLVLVPLKRPKIKNRSLSAKERKQTDHPTYGEEEGEQITQVYSEEFENLFGRIVNVLERYPYGGE